MPKKRKAADLVWSTTDYFGNYVTLGRVTWDAHVLDQHPEMDTYESLVKSTIERPYEIRKSTKNNTALAFSSEPGSGPSTEGIRALVNYADMYFEKGSTVGMIVTAYPVDIAKYGTPMLGKSVYKRGGVK